LSTDSAIVLADTDLERLRILHPEISVDDSINVALAMRLDYQNVREQYEDAGRKIGVAADALKAQVDLVASAGIESEQVKAARFPVPDIDRYQWNAGLVLNLPLDRKAERNTYRRSLINYEQPAAPLSCAPTKSNSKCGTAGARSNRPNEILKSARSA
jgi:outer membrane protein TolC